MPASDRLVRPGELEGGEPTGDHRSERVTTRRPSVDDVVIAAPPPSSRSIPDLTIGRDSSCSLTARMRTRTNGIVHELPSKNGGPIESRRTTHPASSRPKAAGISFLALTSTTADRTGDYERRFTRRLVARLSGARAPRNVRSGYVTRVRASTFFATIPSPTVTDLKSAHVEGSKSSPHASPDRRARFPVFAGRAFLAWSPHYPVR